MTGGAGLPKHSKLVSRGCNVVAVVCATLSGDDDELMSKNHISNLPKYVFRGEIVSLYRAGSEVYLLDNSAGLAARGSAAWSVRARLRALRAACKVCHES